jgi:hypothetical protein
MKTYYATLRATTPYSQGRNHDTPRLPRELHEAYEERVVLHKLHTDQRGEIFIPPTSFKKLLDATALYLKEQIPGRGKETYTKHFVQAVICPEPISLGITSDKVHIQRVFTWSQPTKRSGGRVWKLFPRIDTWEGALQIVCVDDILTLDVVERHLRIGGQITGIGVWRPQNGGMWGKFQVLDIQEVSL